MSYNNEMSKNENENVNIPTVEEEDQEFELPPPPPLQRMNGAFLDFTIDEQGQHVFYFTQPQSEQVCITVLNRQTNGPHPDCDLEFDAASSPQASSPQASSPQDPPVVPTHPLELEFCNFVDDRYSTFYNTMYNFIEPGIIQYTEEEDNTIQVIDLDELVMPTLCPSCYCFDCNC